MCVYVYFLRVCLSVCYVHFVWENSLPNEEFNVLIQNIETNRVTEAKFF